MKLSTSIWLVFSLCLLLVLAAMGWLSATALRLDRAEFEARRQAALEEKVRLALWRMDSALAPTVAQESARPFFAYQAYFPANRAFNRLFNAQMKGDTLIASPLLVETPPRILLHFQIDAAGQITSPQLPPSSQQGKKLANANRDRTLSQELDSQTPPPQLFDKSPEWQKFTPDPELQKKREAQFAHLTQLLSLDKFAGILPEHKPVELRIVGAESNSKTAANKQKSSYANPNDLFADAKPQAANDSNIGNSARSLANAPPAQQPMPPGYGPQSQTSNAGNMQNYVPQTDSGVPDSQQVQMMEQSRREYGQRAAAVKQNLDAMAMNRPPVPAPSSGFGGASPQNSAFPVAKGIAAADKNAPVNSPPPSTDIDGVLMTPLWIDGELLLARRVVDAGQEYVQGCLLDWPEIRRWLKSEIADLLPNAELLPLGATDTAEESRLLAALPLRLVPGTVAAEGDKIWSPLVLSLLAAWVCLTMTAAAIIGLLAGVIRLSSRRASFVTAVTHELRTPLTTFQMYTEMLAEGMVPEESQRREYLKTLRAEAVRLTHLVENVLAFARLERGRLDRRMETVTLGDLVGSMQNRLAERAAQAGMELVVENNEDSSAEGSETRAADTLVKTNISAIEQILFNLVDNACKYAVTAEDKRIQLSLDSKDGEARIRIEDHGPGIAPEMRRRLFHSFSKTAKEAAHSAPGVGLGLALSRRLARDLGGDLCYEAESPAGARFVLKLVKI